ncbi:hypothetical protein [Rufibacter psychrotolerans]|uniref:hypothetical protein n=1 Tax=Rufibacter psychrotolerans TaxID=2812556 RepID=UPI001967872D|nr:hypothetical protein [Rufibacter sp. SYSU D00308]
MVNTHEVVFDFKDNGEEIVFRIRLFQGCFQERGPKTEAKNGNYAQKPGLSALLDEKPRGNLRERCHKMAVNVTFAEQNRNAGNSSGLYLSVREAEKQRGELFLRKNSWKLICYLVVLQTHLESESKAFIYNHNHG